MTDLPHDPQKSPRPGLDGLWAAIAIAAIWMAVLAIGLWGGDITNANGASSSSVPVVTIVAPCALLATIAVARRARR